MTNANESIRTGHDGIRAAAARDGRLEKADAETVQMQVERPTLRPLSIHPGSHAFFRRIADDRGTTIADLRNADTATGIAYGQLFVGAQELLSATEKAADTFHDLDKALRLLGHTKMAEAVRIAEAAMLAAIAGAQ